MSKKCKAYSASKLGLEAPDNRKSFYAGWDAAIAEAEKSGAIHEWHATINAALREKNVDERKHA